MVDPAARSVFDRTASINGVGSVKYKITVGPGGLNQFRWSAAADSTPHLITLPSRRSPDTFPHRQSAHFAESVKLFDRQRKISGRNNFIAKFTAAAYLCPRPEPHATCTPSGANINVNLCASRRRSAPGCAVNHQTPIRSPGLRIFVVQKTPAPKSNRILREERQPEPEIQRTSEPLPE